MIKYIRIVKNFNPIDRIELNKMGIDVKIGWDAIEIPEKESVTLDLLKDYFGDLWERIVTTKVVFSNEDLDSASYLTMYPTKMLGYAKPDTEPEVYGFDYPYNLYPYYKDVFSIIDTDEEYGILRGKQIGNYQLVGEPKWGKASIGSANYIEDAFFVTDKLYNDIFKPLNIASVPVIEYRTNRPLKNIVQIIQQGISDVALDITNTYIQECVKIDKWKMDKFVLKADMPTPPFKRKQPNAWDFFYSHEYFGSGGCSQRMTIISHRLYKQLVESKIKGVNFYPLMQIDAIP